MVHLLKKVLYITNEESFVAVRSWKGFVQVWAIARFRAVCVTIPAKHRMGDVELLVPKKALRRAKCFSDLKREGIVVAPDDWLTKTLNALDQGEKVAKASVEVSDLRAKALPVAGLYCELVIKKRNVECKGGFGTVSIPATLTSPGSIGLNVRYLAEAIENLVSKSAVELEIAQFRDTRVLILSSGYERHYIVEMKQR
jgi:hypothetical protein